MSRWPLRARAFLDANYATVVAVLVALALLGGWLTYGAYVAPGTHVAERTVSSWQSTGQFDHGATVTEENAVFPVGSRLSNRTTYFRAVAPVLNGTFRAGYASADRGDLSAAANVTLVLRSVDQDGEDSTEYWRTARSLGRNEVESLSPGESVSVPFSVDVDAVENRTARIREELGSQPGDVTASVRATVRYTGTVDGERVDRTVEYSLPLGIDGGTYAVDDPGPTRERHEATRSVTVTDDPGPLRAVGGPVALVLALGGLAALSRHREQFALTPAERRLLAFRSDRSDFEEWIVEMRLPDEALDLPRAEAETLADLVDFAIDTDNAVVEHSDGDEFSVVHEGYRYVYVPPTRPADAKAATEESADETGTDDGDATDDGEPDEEVPTAR